MKGNYAAFVQRKLKKGKKIVWLWTGDANKPPEGKLAKLLNYFVAGHEVELEQVLENSPDMGDENERLIGGVHRSAVKEFAQLFAIGVEQVLFRLKETAEDKSNISIKNN